MKNSKKINGYYADKTKIGQRIFNIRNNRKDTLEEFGKLFNAEKSNVLKWEKGLSVPNRSRIEKIAKKGNLTVNELLYGSIYEFIKNNYDDFYLADTLLNYIVNNNIHLDINNIDNIVDTLQPIVEEFNKGVEDAEKNSTYLKLHDSGKEYYVNENITNVLKTITYLDNILTDFNCELSKEEITVVKDTINNLNKTLIILLENHIDGIFEIPKENR
ncbi:helix-turn-helix transcriptional regulator [Gemella sp. GH3]|uniref:helix-turn-helix domain-containing protein n=1 Tax=unclassified Gemella TaxID=2624949 RepID=UPI0015CFAC0D|nr:MULTISPECIES: helix-turn-helix transcriptional regulator [unclassified Gemella]MBF0713549.1 helix-turn-helix transcriptional regulator [Gemella sp. GH3.1]NYS50501.1 helix-turn-helix transcriptional regulator [Gemella sp. GH3]